jgi:hypothetical protein
MPRVGGTVQGLLFRVFRARRVEQLLPLLHLVPDPAEPPARAVLPDETQQDQCQVDFQGVFLLSSVKFLSVLRIWGNFGTGPKPRIRISD